ncbi:uncharacterized protein LOC121879412 [Homarus americanus]|uniref:Putative Chitin binding Peritrophin-A domain-containing protein 9 n=1 Tax=Homarus americanus TaxID=6706 RepID=A0A8J5TK88_HOMAM|nr:uncharacterized protein LOC121879412 [Homarus americanus]KAG7176130.1 putative Chitin binding Peritrophin-A domain-containing protein 9 [Homarus americanus]
MLSSKQHRRLLFFIFFLAVERSAQYCAPNCEGARDGEYITDPSDCTKYYVCIEIEGEMIPSQHPLECPDGYYFNDQHTEPQCDPINDAPTDFCSSLCDPCAVDCNGHNPGTQQPSPRDCSKFEICLAEEDHYLEGDCPFDSEYYDFRTATCQNEYSLCYHYCDPCVPHCVYDGQRIIDPYDCHQFYLCTPPTKAVFLCPHDQVFNNKTQECEADASCWTACQ